MLWPTRRDLENELSFNPWKEKWLKAKKEEKEKGK
jgi:hypothetical protein